MTRIAIDPARLVGRLDRKVFGGFVEHLGRCTLPDVETAQLEEGSEDPKDGMVAVRLPPRSFTEAAMTDRAPRGGLPGSAITG